MSVAGSEPLPSLVTGPGKAPGTAPGRVLVVQHETECPPALVGEWLVEAGCELDVRHVYAGDALPDVSGAAQDHGYAGVLVLGGAMSANDDELLSWIGPTKTLLRDAVAAELPTLGICLGHQLLAASLGGTVEPNPRGRQVGVLEVGWTDVAADDALVGGLATPRRAVQWNEDVVTALPPGAVVLAQTAYEEVQVVRFGAAAWGVQHHPEVDAPVVASWLSETERAEMAERGLDAEALLEEIAAARAELGAAWAPLAARFAELVLARRGVHR